MKKQYHRQATKLSVFTVSYNIIEGVTAFTFGALIQSIPLAVDK